MKCTYQVDDTGHHGADGQCNNRAVKKYSGENHPNGEQRCRLHYYMDREAQLLEQIHQLESGVQLEPMPTDGTLDDRQLHMLENSEHWIIELDRTFQDRTKFYERLQEELSRLRAGDKYDCSEELDAKDEELLDCQRQRNALEIEKFHLLEEIERLTSELHSFPEEEHDPDTDLSPMQFYIDNGLNSPRKRMLYQREHWDSDDELKQPLRHKDCPNADILDDGARSVRDMQCRPCLEYLYSKDQLEKKTD